MRKLLYFVFWWAGVQMGSRVFFGREKVTWRGQAVMLLVVCAYAAVAASIAVIVLPLAEVCKDCGGYPVVTVRHFLAAPAICLGALPLAELRNGGDLNPLLRTVPAF